MFQNTNLFSDPVVIFDGGYCKLSVKHVSEQHKLIEFVLVRIF